MPRVLLMVLSLLVLAGCATPESRLRSGLVEAGLPEPLAACMAERMVDRLSLIQLRRLADLKAAGRAPTREDFLYRVRSLRDPEVLSVTSRAAAACAVALAG